MDDAIAILMALAAPAVEVDGVTVVGGNVPHARGLRNALALLDFVGRRGHSGSTRAVQPSAGRQVCLAPGALSRHQTGLTRPTSGTWRTPPATGADRWTSWPASLSAHYPGEITLVAIRPPDQPGPAGTSASRRLVPVRRLAGDYGRRRGHAPETSHPDAEFNFHCDPQWPPRK